MLKDFFFSISIIRACLDPTAPNQIYCPVNWELQLQYILYNSIIRTEWGKVLCKVESKLHSSFVPWIQCLLFNTRIVGPENPCYVSFAQVETTYIYSILPNSPTYLFKEEKMSYRKPSKSGDLTKKIHHFDRGFGSIVKKLQLQFIVVIRKGRNHSSNCKSWGI